MRYMVMHYQTQAMEDGVPPTAEEQAAIGQYMQEAAMSGVLLSGEESLPAHPAPAWRSPTGKCGSSTGPTPKPRS
jgi:hypothetical protein